MAMQTLRPVIAALWSLAGAGSAMAAPVPSAIAASASACCHLSAASPITIELAEDVSTKTRKRGDTFAIRLAEPIVVDRQVLIPAGAPGGGEVVDVAPGGIAGRPGKLILAARFLTYNGVRVPLHGFRLSGTGRDNATLVETLGAVPYVGILAVTISGGNVVFPSGTRAVAKVTSDTDLSALFSADKVQSMSIPGTTP